MTKPAVKNAKITASETHSGFDNDPVTMNHDIAKNFA
jgi:hypothetical protein